MKRILFLMITISMSLSGYAQNEFSSKFKAIPPKNTAPKIKKPIPPKASVPPVKTPNVFKNPELLNPKPSASAPVAPANNFSMIPKNEFINPGDVYRDKWNKKEEKTEGLVYRKNQDLGNFTTGSVTAKVLYRDAAYVDGDQIRVYLNDKVIQYQVNLESNFQGFEIVLEKGFNKIEFEALNQGSSGPNTAEFKVYNDKGGLISGSQWNLGTGFKATIILVKE
ncbi:hypothetical protein EKM02_13730 [Flavobacterium sp. RSP49]|uniref:hypothetical protein n=1 Tax=unclassified Flavobacterium TaxID=196869 RepID=UPI000F836BE1|nr:MULTISPECIES: hypothetical protein [unclassified Flavobacterium]RTY85489.1 hypothetical protein EKM00_14360 [Flavobacterium sp. RSP15]RTY97439.1 hypothetical protein EKM02_13730 [Flavobacterium sp. RSP49]